MRPPTLKEAVLVFTALFGIRSFALAVNNIVDMEIDAKNPRTAKRPLPSGRVSVREAWALALVSLFIYFVSAYLLNVYALLLSPIFPIMAYVYPYIKRKYPIAHFWLGSVLGGAVVGGAIAVSGDAPSLLHALLSVPWAYVAAVACWVASFDVLYAVLDVEFDRKEGLHSLPADFGVERALRVSKACALAFAWLAIWSVKLYSLNAASAALTAAGLALLFELFGEARKDVVGAARRSLDVNILVGLAVGGAPLLKLLPLP
ncbi:4-hydroxybenzoate polyprenyltransferase, putative [Ignicoccus hospitalis KIN4/I]|uniref:4-hydroxybenzoate polyprenyltransferase, putative n=1 Tax=Ignicoccus hospitalis (strain KIN4/I / DSM 18386 / JCM 14125) TaxID=453591 RepID=A8A9N8_IGNH4|nr:4-hydroxybenzoate polyprenyltransferase, putative [Ignicoccus hospitalis KIN4/I]